VESAGEDQVQTIVNEVPITNKSEFESNLNCDREGPVETVDADQVQTVASTTPIANKPEFESTTINTRGRLEKSKEWLAKKTPKLTESFMRSRATIEKGLASVKSYTSTGSKLLISEAKRRYWCKSGKIEDPEITTIITRMIM